MIGLAQYLRCAVPMPVSNLGLRYRIHCQQIRFTRSPEKPPIEFSLRRYQCSSECRTESVVAGLGTATLAGGRKGKFLFGLNSCSSNLSIQRIFTVQVCKRREKCVEADVFAIFGTLESWIPIRGLFRFWLANARGREGQKQNVLSLEWLESGISREHCCRN